MLCLDEKDILKDMTNEDQRFKTTIEFQKNAQNLSPFEKWKN